ncbi:hypothetical protein J3A83DRAFT_4095043 [Scleroderma citrinum]
MSPGSHSPNDTPCLDHDEPPHPTRDRSLTPTDSGKGKGVALVEPLSIPTSVSSDDPFDSPSISRFIITSDNVAAGSSQHSRSLLLESSQLFNSSLSRRRPESPSSVNQSLSDLTAPPNTTLTDASFSSKGKGRDVAPTLPPLSFSPAEHHYSTFDWPCAERSPSSPDPSSYGSGHTSLLTASSRQSHVNPTQAHESGSRKSSQPPSLRRSQSNFSMRSARSSAAQSMTKIKLKLGSSSKAPVNFARKFLSRNKPGDAQDVSLTGAENSPTNQSIDELHPEHENYPFSCHALDSALKMPTSSGLVEIGDITAILSGAPISWDPSANHSDPVSILKGKGRSYSSPFPKSAFDFVPEFEPNAFIPLSLHHARNIFDEVLPRELKLQVFSALIKLHEEEHQQLILSGKWTFLKASSSKNRWVGRNRAMRELVKFSRVSKTWRSLVFDGQLWEDVDLRAFPKLPATFLSELAKNLGPFVKSLDLSGHTDLAPSTLVDMSNSLCMRSAPTLNFTYTQLTSINLRGCPNLTTQSLHSLLIRSPFLRNLCVSGLAAVSNATLDVLALCQHLTSINMNRCANIDGEGVRAFGAAVLARGARLALKGLRLSGLRDISDDVLATLGKAAPDLEVLDLSYCRSLHNSALAAFVSCTEGDENTAATVSLTAREAGLDVRDSRRHIRRVTALRHLSLSHCILLTDIACSNLAHALPRLEFLELAGIGGELNDDGLLKLLKTTPLLRRLDLEDAPSITDAVLMALTPVDDGEDTSTSGTTPAPRQTGHALEHLVVSYASRLTNEGFTGLIQGCRKLQVLEADSTLITGSVLKEFIRTVRERKIKDAGFVAVDCRLVGENVVKDVTAHTRPRKGWRSWEARKLGYLDGQDGENLKVGQDECDESRVVLKSFYNWQTVDAVRAARERRRKAMKKALNNGSSEQVSELEDAKWTGKIKWWSPSRRSSGNNTPGVDDSDRDGCIVM